MLAYKPFIYMSLDSKTTFLKISVVKSVVVTYLQLYFFALQIYYWVFGVFFLVFGDSFVNTATEI